MTIRFRDWEAFAEDETVNLDLRYKVAVMRMAMMMANSEIDRMEEQGEEVPDDMRVTNDDESIVDAVAMGKGETPKWWPKKLLRMEVRITVQRSGETPEKLTPYPIDPNRAGLGIEQFRSSVKRSLNGTGEPFEGAVRVQIINKQDSMTLNQWRAPDVFIGEKDKKGKGVAGQSTEKDEMFQLMLDQYEKTQEGMQRMFGNASNVIQASAAGMAAMRGANPAPPWMRSDGSTEGLPVWAHLAEKAMIMVGQSGLLGGATQSDQAVKSGPASIEHPVKTPGALGGYGGNLNYGYGGPPQIQGPTMNEPGDYDGLYAQDDDLVKDGYEEDDEFFERIEEGDEKSAKTKKHIIEEEEDEDEEDNEAEDEDEDEEEEDRPRRRSRPKPKKSKDPFEGMTPDEILKALSAYIDNNPDKKREIKGMGMELAKKMF